MRPEIRWFNNEFFKHILEVLIKVKHFWYVFENVFILIGFISTKFIDIVLSDAPEVLFFHKHGLEISLFCLKSHCTLNIEGFHPQALTKNVLFFSISEYSDWSWAIERPFIQLESRRSTRYESGLFYIVLSMLHSHVPSIVLQK